jgi:hypothetical protein
LKDTLGSRPFDLLGSSPSCTREFLLEWLRGSNLFLFG